MSWMMLSLVRGCPHIFSKHETVTQRFAGFDEVQTSSAARAAEALEEKIRFKEDVVQTRPPLNTQRSSEAQAAPSVTVKRCKSFRLRLVTPFFFRARIVDKRPGCRRCCFHHGARSRSRLAASWHVGNSEAHRRLSSPPRTFRIVDIRHNCKRQGCDCDCS